jgi:hypothetical protein
MHRRATGGGGALREVSRLGKLAQAGGTSTGVFRSERRAARRSSPLSQGRRRDGFRKGRWSRPSSLRGTRESFWFGCPHVVTQLQKSSGGVWSRISSVIALQKQRQDRVNGDLARSERRWVKPSTGAASERSVGVPASFPREREGSGEDPRWRESAIERSAHRPKRWCVGRGTGAVMATGSYEGSLPMEGIPDHTRYRLSRDGADGGLGGSPHPPIRSNP